MEPTVAEERAVERLLAIDVPSREEMREIETSSRLYEENGTLYMTATVKLPLLVFPAPSVAEQFTVVVPAEKELPETGEQLIATVPLTRSFADAV